MFEDFYLAGRNAPVTGAGSGVGRVVVRELARYGAAVAATAGREAALASVTNEIEAAFGAGALALPADIRGKTRGPRWSGWPSSASADWTSSSTTLGCWSVGIYTFSKLWRWLVDPNDADISAGIGAPYGEYKNRGARGTAGPSSDRRIARPNHRGPPNEGFCPDQSW